MQWIKIVICPTYDWCDPFPYPTNYERPMIDNNVHSYWCSHIQRTIHVAPVSSDPSAKPPAGAVLATTKLQRPPAALDLGIAPRPVVRAVFLGIGAPENWEDQLKWILPIFWTLLGYLVSNVQFRNFAFFLVKSLNAQKRKKPAYKLEDPNQQLQSKKHMGRNLSHSPTSCLICFLLGQASEASSTYEHLQLLTRVHPSQITWNHHTLVHLGRMYNTNTFYIPPLRCSLKLGHPKLSSNLVVMFCGDFRMVLGYYNLSSVENHAENPLYWIVTLWMPIIHGDKIHILL